MEVCIHGAPAACQGVLRLLSGLQARRLWRGLLTRVRCMSIVRCNKDISIPSLLTFEIVACILIGKVGGLWRLLTRGRRTTSFRS